MHRHRYLNSAPAAGQKAQLVLAYQELGKELNSTQLKVVGNYTLGRIIGEGSFGTVRIGIHRLTGTRVAIKHIPKSTSPPLLTREIHHHRRLHHPNVVQLYEVIATEHSIWLITELCAGGELFDYLVEKARFTEAETRRLFGQICLGLGYVHREGVVHRDLKLENVLLDERCNPKLADFGFGREFEQRKMLDTFCGTTGYAAPEMLAGRKYLGEQVDIWSLGIIFYSLLTGSLPFDDDDEDVMKSLILAGQFDIPQFLSHEARDLISKILQQDPLARPSIEQILSHAWFTTPPSQHTIPEPELSSRPSTIVEEDQPLTTSPSSTRSLKVSHDEVDLTIAQSPSYANSLKRHCDVIAESDTSGSSSKESDLGISSSRSLTSSPVTSEDHFDATCALDPDQPTPVQGRRSSSAKSKPTSLVLQHRNNSNSTIRKSVVDPMCTPCPPSRNSGSGSACQRAGQLDEVSESRGHSDLLVDQNQSSKSDKLDDRSSTSSSNTAIASEVIGSRKRRPPSIVPSFPSSALHHPQIRTPSRTKRRSNGSTLSERLGPIEDLDPSGLPVPLSTVLPSVTSTPPSSALSSSMPFSIVIDYLGAFKISKPTSLMTEEDTGLLKSLSAIGFDTGQVLHSVQSNACDSSGAMWWLIKRKAEKQAAEKEYAKRASARLSGTSTIVKPMPLPWSTIEQAGPHVEVYKPESRPSVVPDGSSRPSLDRLLPASFPTTLRQPTSHGDLRLNKGKPILSSSQTIEPIINAVKIGGQLTDSTIPTPIQTPVSSDRKKQSPLVTLMSEDGISSTSSFGLETPVSDKDGPLVCESGKVKVTPENRKRSQSVSMLQRATHALASKKLGDESFTKHAKAKLKDSLFVDGSERPLSEKRSKKELKAKEKEGKMAEEANRLSPSLPRTGLFSRKTPILSSQPPQIPVLLTPEFSVGSLGVTPVDKAVHHSSQLESPEVLRPSLSMPSSPSKPGSSDSSRGPRRGSDPSSAKQPDNQSPAELPTISASTSSSTVTPGSLFTNLEHDQRPKTISSTDTGDTSSTVAPDGSSPGPVSDAMSSLIKAKAKGHAQVVDRESPTEKGGRAKGSNLFSSFRFWFNEDRRKRKRKTTGPLSYTSIPHQALGRANSYGSSRGVMLGSVNSVNSPNSGGSRIAHSETVGPSSRPSAVAGSVHRQASVSSHRSSLHSNRRVSLDMVPTRRMSKRRSDSSRASLGSLNGTRTPTSDLGSHNSALQNVLPRTSLDGSRGKRATNQGHHRQNSTGSAGSRLSHLVVQHLNSNSTAINHPGTYLRRTPSNTTTVRRITAAASGIANRQRNSRAQSGSSSVRTSMSSDDGCSSSQRPDDLKLHSPINVHDVEETIEEEDDDEEELGDQSEARELALKKLSGDGQKMMKALESAESGSQRIGGSSSYASRPSATTTIFLAQKPHSVFGTPTQAFFNRAASSPVATKFNLPPPIGSSSYFSAFNTLGGSRQKIRDVFASKQSEDGEWVDIDEDDDVCARFGGGLGQSIHLRSDHVPSKPPPQKPVARPASEPPPPPPVSTPTVFEKMNMGRASAFSTAMNSRPASSGGGGLLGEGRYAGIQASALAKAKGVDEPVASLNSQPMSQRATTGHRTFKSVAIVEEEEEEE